MSSRFVLGPSLDAARAAQKALEAAKLEAARHMGREPYRSRLAAAQAAAEAAWGQAHRAAQETFAALDVAEAAPRPTAHEEMEARLRPQRVRAQGGVREAMTRAE